MTARQPRPGVPVPPESLLEEWRQEYMNDPEAGAWPGSSTKDGAVKGAAWGADEQLRLCVEWFHQLGIHMVADDLHRAMRPQPPTLKQQALAQLRALHDAYRPKGLKADTDMICRALEALPDE